MYRLYDMCDQSLMGRSVCQPNPAVHPETHIIEKYGCRLILGSLILRAGFLWRSYRSDVSGLDAVRAARNTCTADQTLGILVHTTIFGELKFILEYPRIHVGVIVGPEGSLDRTVSGCCFLAKRRGSVQYLPTSQTALFQNSTSQLRNCKGVPG